MLQRFLQLFLYILPYTQVIAMHFCLSSWNQWLTGPTPCRSQLCAFFCATHDKIKHCAKDFSIQTLTSTNLLPHLCKWYSPDPRPKSTGHTVSIPQISLRTPPLQCLVPRKCSQTVDNVPELLLLCLPLFFPRYLSHYILPFKCLFCFILICFFLLHASVFEH